MVIASGFVLINMVVDILYGYLDPRIRFKLAGMKDCLVTNTEPARLASEENYRSANLWLETLRNLRHSPSALLGMAIIGALVVIAVFAPLFATHDPIKTMIGVPGRNGPVAQQIALYPDPGL